MSLTPGSRYNRWEAFRLAAILLLLLLSVRPAAAQNPLPLPHDPSLAACVTISGWFQSLTLGQTRSLTMSVWAAAFAPGETFDFSALDSRAFLTLDLPEEGGWGLFEALDPHLTFQVRLTDTQNRLGSVRVFEMDTGRLVATLAAFPGGAQIQGSFQNDAAVRDYRMEIRDPNGILLSTLAVNAGRWDTVYPFTLTGGFEPYYPPPISAPPHYTIGPNDVFGTQGDPEEAPGVRSGIPMGFSKSTCALDYINDRPASFLLEPPAAFARYAKRDVIANTVDIARFKVGDPQAWTSLQNALSQASQRDPARALGSLEVTPYTDATALWKIEFRGLATAVLAVPFEKKRKASGFHALVSAIATNLRPRRGFLSILGVSAADLWLSDINNQQSSGFKQGDVIAWGDIYALLAAESTKGMVRIDPILQDVTFTLQPDIPPPSGQGSALLAGQGAWTTPAPPVPQSGANLLFHSGSAPAWTVTIPLPKGFKWSITGSITSPMGYQAGSAISFQTPVSGPVHIPCTLTVLLQWKVYTVSAANPSGPMSLRVHILNASGAIVAEGDSVMQPDRRYAFSVLSLPPGVYTVRASRVTSGGSWSGTATVQVQRGVLQETILTVHYTPPGPPRP
jgi:hypothetical protein